MAKEVDTWMAKYNNPMKPVVERIREIILGADSRITEVIKWQTPTFFYKGNLVSFQPRAKRFASLLFHTGALIEGDFPSLEGGEQTARYVRFADLEEVASKEGELRRIVVAWCEQKDAG